MPTKAQRDARCHIETRALNLMQKANHAREWARQEHGGRCNLCRSPKVLTEVGETPWLPEGLKRLAATPEGRECPMRHFVGQVNTWFRITSPLPIRRKNAIEKALWELFPGARDDLKMGAAA